MASARAARSCWSRPTRSPRATSRRRRPPRRTRARQWSSPPSTGPRGAGRLPVRPDYVNPGTIVVAASGDSGYSGSRIASRLLPSVLAVGGTAARRSSPDGAYRGETRVDRPTSGCSLYEAAAVVAGRARRGSGCGPKRAVADLAAVAEPGPLVHIQDIGSPCGPAWCEADGTSVSAPIIAGDDRARRAAPAAPSCPVLYAHARSDPGAFHDVTTGADGRLHRAGDLQRSAGYDGPTGLGTPYGLAAFLAEAARSSAHHPSSRSPRPTTACASTGGWTARLTCATATRSRSAARWCSPRSRRRGAHERRLRWERHRKLARASSKLTTLRRLRQGHRQRERDDPRRCAPGERRPSGAHWRCTRLRRPGPQSS